jgi:hypothetical protein
MIFQVVRSPLAKLNPELIRVSVRVASNYKKSHNSGDKKNHYNMKKNQWRYISFGNIKKMVRYYQ